MNAEIFNIGNEAPVVHSLNGGEIPEMVLNQDDGDNSDDENDNTAGKLPVDLVEMCARFLDTLKPYIFRTRNHERL